MLLYGLKGMAAYAHHARRLGKIDEEVDAFIEEALFATMTNVNFDLDTLLELVLECGEQNLRVMEMLDEGHVETLRQARADARSTKAPRPAPASWSPATTWSTSATCSKQCEGTDVKVYTHGEMLPAHMYPKLREHPNLAGHYGGAWQKQKTRVRRRSPARSSATTNCILIPQDELRRPPVHDPGDGRAGRHAHRGRRLLAGDRRGAACEPLREQIAGESTVGFHRTRDPGRWPDTIVDAVKAGKISRFFVIGGCDGAEPGRNYFTDYAPGHAGRLVHPHPRLRQVPHPRPRLRRAPGPAAPARHGPVQRRLRRDRGGRRRWPRPSTAASTTCR